MESDNAQRAEQRAGGRPDPPPPFFGNQNQLRPLPEMPRIFSLRGGKHRDLIGILLEFRPDGFCSENDCPSDKREPLPLTAQLRNYSSILGPVECPPGRVKRGLL